MRTWMKLLAEHYESFRNRFPEERLLLVFDIDGTILDMRYMIHHALKSFDAINGTDYFASLGWKEIDFHEEHIHRLFEKRNIPEAHREAIRNQYGKLLLSTAAVIEAHRPFRGVLDVIRWFQLQPNTFVGLNTGRPEALRRDTLGSLNELGRQFKVRFSDDLLFMRPDDCEQDISSVKPEGIRHFKEMGYKVFAFVDNEPENLETVSRTDPEKEILLLHADTIFKSAHTAVPERAVKGSVYDIKELVSDKPLPQHIQLVWRCTYDRESLAAFMGSNIHWLEIDLHEALKPMPDQTREPSLFECLDLAMAGEKCIKFDVGPSVLVYERALEIAAAYRLTGPALWFKLEDNHVLRGGYLARLREAYPEAIIEYDVDFITRAVLNEPADAREILTLLQRAGINRFSLKLQRPAWRRIATDLTNWGFDIHMNAINNFEKFLQAALFTPRSMTLHFGFTEWRYFVCAGEDQGQDDPMLKLTA
jgi:hypothetical protein